MYAIKQTDLLEIILFCTINNSILVNTNIKFQSAKGEKDFNPLLPNVPQRECLAKILI